MDPITTALTASGLIAFAKFASQKLRQKFRLAYQFRRAIGIDPEKDHQDNVLRALQIAFGNALTINTNENDALLDLSNSGLIELLVPIFGSEIDKTNAYSIIEYVLRSRGVSDNKRIVIFQESLSKCIRKLANNYNNDISKSAENEIYRHHMEVLNQDAQRSDGILNTIIETLVDEDSNWLNEFYLNPVTISKHIKSQFDPIYQYVSSLSKIIDSVDVHGASGDVLTVQLDEIFVDVPIGIIPRTRNFNRYRDLRDSDRQRVIATNWKSVADFVEKTVLLGDPGGGKSTLSKKLCFETARSYLEGYSVIPVFIQLRTYIAELQEDSGLSLVNYIVESIRAKILDSDGESAKVAILYHLRIGAAFIFADGLDEVLTAANRAKVVKELNRLSREFPLCKILVTSRYVGYESQPLQNFNHLGVQSLNISSIKEVYKKVSKVVLHNEFDVSENTVSEFISDARKKAQEIIHNPLLLTLVIIIYNKKSEIPDNRATLYGYCAELLFDRWDSYRSIEPDLPEKYRLFDLFKYLSSILYENEDYGGRISKDDLFIEARKFFRKDYIDNKEGRSAVAANKMVEHLTVRSWILHEIGENIFEFTHRTFLEFFYAKYLDEKYERTERLITECITNVLSNTRILPSHLCLQLRTYNKREASNVVVKKLMEAIREKPNEYILIDFGLDTLGYLLPDAQTLVEYVSVLAPIVIHNDDRGAKTKLLCTTSPMRSHIVNASLPVLESVRTVADIFNMEWALRKLSKEDYHILVNGVEVRLVEVVMEKVFSRQTVSPYLVKLAFDLDSAYDGDALRKFGVRLWRNTQTERFPNEMLTSDVDKMLDSVIKYIVYGGDMREKYIQLGKSLERDVIFNDKKLDFGSIYIPSKDCIAHNMYIDHEDWIEDTNMMEFYLFCLILYAECNFDVFSKAGASKHYKFVVDLFEYLEEQNTEKGPFFKQVIKGKRTILKYPISNRVSITFANFGQ